MILSTDLGCEPVVTVVRLETGMIVLFTFLSSKFLNFNGGTLRRGSHFRVIIACLFHHLVENVIVVRWVMVEQHQFFRARLHHDVNGLAPMTVPPATASSGVFIWQILRVVDENVCAGRQLSD